MRSASRLRLVTAEPIRNADDLADRLRQAAQFVAHEHPDLAEDDLADWQSQIDEQRYRLARLRPADRDQIATLLADAQARRDPEGFRRVVNFLNDKLG